MADCAWYDLVCKGGDKVGDAVDNQMQEFAKSISDLATSIMKWLNSWWMSAPAPDLKADPIARVAADLEWYTAAFAIIGFLFALGRMALSQEFKSLIGGVQPIVNLIMVVACYATGLTYALTAGDEFSTWIMGRVSMEGQGGSDISVLVALGPTLGVGGWILFGILATLGAAMNFAFMIFRNVLLTIMIAILPTVAASTGTEAGKQAFAKANGYLLAFVLFKPVAAIIYALGLWFFATPLGEDSKGSGAGDMGEAAVAAMMGMAIIVLAALALPALMKFLIPIAATGAGAFSGGAALAGAATVAAGAAVVAATGVAGAAAGGGAVAAGGGAAAGGGELRLPVVELERRQERHRHRLAAELPRQERQAAVARPAAVARRALVALRLGRVDQSPRVVASRMEQVHHPISHPRALEAPREPRRAVAEVVLLVRVERRQVPNPLGLSRVAVAVPPGPARRAVRRPSVMPRTWLG